MKARTRHTWALLLAATVAVASGCGGEDQAEAPLPATSPAQPAVTADDEQPPTAIATEPVVSSEPAQAGVITAVAGTGERGFSGDGEPATAAQLNWLNDEWNPRGLALDAEGNLYVADMLNNRIRKVDPSGAITTIAGTGEAGLTGDGGPASSAQLNWPGDLFVDQAGNLYIADRCNQRVRRIDGDGVISTVAGSTALSSNCIIDGRTSGDGGQARAAELDNPGGIAVDSSGNLYIAEWSGHVVRRVDPNGVITIIAGTGEVGFSGDGGPATEAQLSWPSGIALDSAGNLYVADSCNHRIRRIDTSGVITTVVGSGAPPKCVVGAPDPGSFGGDGGPATDATLNVPSDIILDAVGNLYIADNGNHRIRMVDAEGVITTIAGTGEVGSEGDGGPATEADVCAPSGLALDPAGNLYVSERCGVRVRKVTSAAR